MAIPEMDEFREWSPAAVRQTCIDYGLYKHGNESEFEGMLRSVETASPSPRGLYLIAEDIHFMMTRKAVRTTARISGPVIEKIQQAIDDAYDIGRLPRDMSLADFHAIEHIFCCMKKGRSVPCFMENVRNFFEKCGVKTRPFDEINWVIDI